jgi:hypothetical protein
MNIFYIDRDPKKSAEAMTNKHVVKMIPESAQLMSTAHRMLDGEHYIDASSGRRLQRWRMLDPVKEQKLYKATHFNHPSAIWVRESIANYYWLYEHFIALCEEYTKRYKKTHATEIKLAEILSIAPKNIPAVPMTPIRLAITNKDYIVEDRPVSSYRNYYEAEKLITPEDIERYYRVLKLERKLR